ncbi:hypothetical protein DMUE_0315 [Dictyocoela muelleri]|nr:hypothetical protein DMUE_0315 [Dictyocoela muelleri]
MKSGNGKKKRKNLYSRKNCKFRIKENQPFYFTDVSILILKNFLGIEKLNREKTAPCFMLFNLIKIINMLVLRETHQRLKYLIKSCIKRSRTKEQGIIDHPRKFKRDGFEFC